MGDQISCCDAKSQLDNIQSNGLTKLTPTTAENNIKSLNFIPTMSNNMK
jgi:hypothetical protein